MSYAARTPQQMSDGRDAGLDEFGRLAELTGRNIVELAGFLDAVEHQADTQPQHVDHILAQRKDLSQTTRNMTAGLVTRSRDNAQAWATVESTL